MIKLTNSINNSNSVPKAPTEDELPMNDNSSKRRSSGATMDSSSSRRGSSGFFAVRVPSLTKGRRFSAFLTGTTTATPSGSEEFDDDDEDGKKNIKARKTWPGILRSFSNYSAKSVDLDDDDDDDLQAPHTKRESSLSRRVSNFFADHNKTTKKKRSSRAEAGESWAHQTVKIRPKLFVTELEGRQLEDDYEIGKLLGQGGYGQVFECVHKESGAERAVKKMSKSGQDPDELMQEFAVLRELEHPNILKNYALYQDDDHFSVVTDVYKGGDLLDLIHERTLSEADTALLIKHVLSCINYCHINGIVHRDLKPENILLEETQNFRDVKLIDFGLAARIQTNDDEDNTSKFTGTAGSIYYMSPQIVEGSYTQACDIWSTGVICYMLMSGYAPFDGDDNEEIVDQIMQGTVYFDDPVWDDISDDALDFVEYLLTVKEEDRPTAAQALQHKWLQKYCDNDEEDEEKADNKHQSIQRSMEGLKQFKAPGKLQQVAYSLIASQLLSKQDKESIDQDFRTLDVDCDGKLSPQDLQTSHKWTGYELDQEELNRIMVAVNYSGSGTVIEYSEFVAATMMHNKLVTMEMLTSVFRIIDADHTGYLSVDNVHQALGLEKGTMEAYVLHKIIEPVDSTGKGTISLEDFVSMMAGKKKNKRRQNKRPAHLARSFQKMPNRNRIAEFSNTIVSGITSGTNNFATGLSSGSKSIAAGVSKGLASGTNNIATGISSGSKSLAAGVSNLVTSFPLELSVSSKDQEDSQHLQDDGGSKD